MIEEYKDKYNRIIIEGHRYEEVRKFFDDITAGVLICRKQVVEGEVAHKSLKGRVSFHVCDGKDTILGDNRRDTGRFEVRTAGYYEELLDKILGIRNILPLLVSLDNDLDKEIGERLKK